MADDSLPNTTDPETHGNPAEKVMQIGEDAATKIIEGFLNKGSGKVGVRTATLLVDLTTHTADVVRGFVIVVQQAGCLAVAFVLHLQ